MARSPIYGPRGQVIGHVEGTVFRKELDSRLHFLRKPPAIAFSLDSLEQARQAGAEEIEVDDRATGKVYRASLITLLERGTHIKRGGFEEQLYLPLGMWKTPDNVPEQEPLF